MGAERVVVLVYRLPRQLGRQATSQKNGRQKKTDFHIIFDFDLEFEVRQVQPHPAQRWRPGRAVCWFLLQF
jgi:hypothetical protein